MIAKFAASPLWAIIQQGLIQQKISTRPTTKTVVKLEQEQPVHTTSQAYLSFSIDISVLAGGYWWEGSGRAHRGMGTLRVAPLDLRSRKLNILARALAPAVLRVGGSEADKIHYFKAPASEKDTLVLQRQTWDYLHEFVQRNQFQLAFTIKYGLFKRSQHGQWCESEVQTLLQYSKEKNYHIDVCELGNELNAYWAFYGLLSQPRARDLAADYHTFAEVIRRYQPTAQIIGPGSAFWPHLGETLKPFSNITSRFLQECRDNATALHIVDWHYYPFQSLRAPIRTRTATPSRLLNPRALNDFKKYSQQLKALRDEYFPRAQLWTGETGSAQCGGQPKISDRFVSCFWWADQLGLGAQLGQNVMVRQSLVGGDYGLIDRLTNKPRPDYWLSWLWKQLMGCRVYRISAPHPMLRAYCHDGGTHARRCLLLINLSAKPMQVDTQGLGKLQRQYAVTAKRLKSKKVYINGVKARFRGGSFSLDDFPQLPASDTISRHSIHFWLFD